MNFDYFEGRPVNYILEHLRRIQENNAVRRNLRDAQNPSEMPVSEFIFLYRMPQHVLLDLVEIIRPHVRPGIRKTHIPLELKVLCAVGFYAVGSYQRPHGRSGDFSQAQSTVSKCIAEITAALNTPAVLLRFIKFPTTIAGREAIILRNEVLGMWRALGFIDGTLIRIVSPKREKQVYRCRKGFCALNVQIVCDADLNIMNVNARFPGSASDPYIYRSSAVRHAMITAYRESRCWLLGDSAYPHEPWMMLPLIHAQQGTPEYIYTKLHCHCRNAVERCIGVLKNRWRCLLIDRTLHYEPEKAGAIVNACVLLHNYLNQLRIPPPPPVY